MTAVLPTATIMTSSGKWLSLDTPQVMGILNATPDSFYNRGHRSSPQDLLESAAQMIAEGATLLDIGGASSRPGATLLSIEEELARVLPVLKLIRHSFPEVWLSIDTWQAEVARQAVEAGADMVNDISAGLLDPYMLNTVAAMKVPYIAMHMQGRPDTMQQDPQYDDVLQEVIAFFVERMQVCRQAGIVDIILDPGFGFGKTLAHNYTLLQHFDAFAILGKPLLAGISRKRMVYGPLDTDAAGALNGSTALHMPLLMKGAKILRVHDVKEAIECVKLYAQCQAIG